MSFVVPRILFPEEKNFYSVILDLKNYLILYLRRNESDRISKFFFYLEPDRASTVHLLENHEAANWSLRQGDKEVNKINQWNDPSFIFFYHFSCRKDQFTVFNWKFDSQYFTDPDPLKIRRTLNGLSLWFCLHKFFLNKLNKRKNIYLNKFSQYFGLKTYLPQGLKEKWR